MNSSYTLAPDLAKKLLQDHVAPADVIAAIRGAGHEPFDGGAFDINLVAVRHPDRGANRFNDKMHILYRGADREWDVFTLSVTTDPGTTYLRSPSRPNGTAIIKAGFYAKLWKLGLHKGEKRALVQAAAVTVWRDNDRDAELDIGAPSSTETGNFGINFHRGPSRHDPAHPAPVNNWSAGCVVAQEEQEFLDALALCDLQVLTHPSWQTFSLLLLEA